MENIDIAKRNNVLEENCHCVQEVKAWALSFMHMREHETEKAKHALLTSDYVLAENCISCGDVGTLNNEIECNCKHITSHKEGTRTATTRENACNQEAETDKIVCPTVLPPLRHANQ